MSSVERVDSQTPESCVVCKTGGNIAFCCIANGFQVFTCSTCDTDFVFPSPGTEFLKDFYSREQWFEGGEPGGYKNYEEQTRSSVEALAMLFDRPASESRRVLDIGCGYGAHLQFAQARGWDCTGVEISTHARAMAQQRLQPTGLIVESIAALPDKSFDLILFLDVIEHLPDPYPIFEELIDKGAIHEASQLVITTPNARSDEAVNDPAGWQFRHPPSHLTYYSARSLDALFSRLRFTRHEASGLHPTRRATEAEGTGLRRFAGLMGTATARQE